MFSLTRLKNLLILLLALAIPLQGYAAAAMVFCGPEKPVAAMAASSAGHAGMAHHHADAQDAVQVLHGDSDHASTHDKSSTSCSSCAACCVGVLPVNAPLAAVQPLPVIHPLLFPLSGFVGYTPENPERPPSLLA
ncbi:hypothetical protein [Collimonas sp.]|jgi:hypothetical protein|uniref:hypothetical protein n=1 Tax=Collimonas sp. TaxID=1963772 RepID=UPI002BFB4B0D|nr:hypothetical protein [Collimonas sp.]HWX03132.1 hypothetical protein [Collimonas sp.]